MEASIVEAVDGDREHCRFMAEVAQKAERYEDMVMYMRRVIKLADADRTDPSTEERMLLAAAYKGAVNARRSARLVVEAMEEEKKGECAEAANVVRTDGSNGTDVGMFPETDGLICTATHETEKDRYEDIVVDASRIGSMEPQMRNNHNEPAPKLLAHYRELIEGEICHLCYDLIKLLDEHVHADEQESKAFFLKLKADNLRYIAEVQTGQLRKDTSKETLSLYRAAQDIVKKYLPATHDTRLGLALNFSVFYVDIMDSTEIAISLAKEAVQEAMEEVDKLNEILGKKGAAILELIQDNIKLWSNDGDEEEYLDSKRTESLYRLKLDETTGDNFLDIHLD